ncbi:MAG: hypothetical protein WBB70_11415 [Desulfobacterales bacterium]
MNSFGTEEINRGKVKAKYPYYVLNRFWILQWRILRDTYVLEDLTMNITAMAIALIDNGGRRLGIDRRQFLYTNHIPDRRLGDDRRIGLDRRDNIDRRSGKMVIIKNRKDLREEKDRRSSLERRSIFSDALSS